MSNQPSVERELNHLLDREARIRAVRPRWRVPVWLVILIALGVLGGAAALYYWFKPLDAPLPDGVETRYAGIPQSSTAQGWPRLGDPNAPVLVEDFSSFACPHCQKLHATRFAALLDEIAAGQVQYVFFPVPHIGSGADDASKAALCAQEQGRFWEMHDVLFDWSERFLVRTFDTRRLQKGAEALGLDGQAFEACMDSRAAADRVQAVRDEFNQRGLRGTPTIYINGQQAEDYYRELEELDTSGSAAPAGEDS